jgi:5-oxoprolinase (ATP-hydrolysing)
MPPDSTHIDQEGVLFDNFHLVDRGTLKERELLDLLGSGPYPARNPTQNVADLQAQVASCQRGANELGRVVAQFGLETVRAYTGHVQDNAEESVRRVLDVLDDGEFEYAHDLGPVVKVRISIDREARRAKVDFTGTSPQQPWNFNAPAAVTRPPCSTCSARWSTRTSR